MIKGLENSVLNKGMADLSALNLLANCYELRGGLS